MLARTKGHVWSVQRLGSAMSEGATPATWVGDTPTGSSEVAGSAMVDDIVVKLRWRWQDV